MNLRFLFLTIFLMPLLVLAQETGKIDTVKVIDRPNQVVIAEDDGQVVVNVNGAYRDEDYKYEYRAKPSTKGFISEQNENHKLRFEHPFSKCDNDSSKRSFEVFMSDLYFGWGGNSVEAGTRDIIKRSHSEIGILNFVGLGVNLNRTKLSLGVGFNWAWYGLNKPYLWDRTPDGAVGIGALEESFSKHRASLSVWSMQFPIMVNQYLGKHWNIAAGPILNWNYYADVYNGYSNGFSTYSVTTEGLHQRKFSVDGIVMVSWKGIGAYFRYAPQSVFKNDFGPEIKNRWTVGLVLRGLGFRGK